MKVLLKAVLLCSTLCSVALATEARSPINLPLQFEENRGQTSEPVRYLLRASGVLGYFTDDGALFRLGQGGEPAAVKVEFVGAQEGVRPVGEGKTPTETSYFIGNDPEKWRRSIPHFERLRYRAIYQGIDLVYYERNRRLEYDFVLRPGGAVDDVRMRFHGADSLVVTPEGDLSVSAGGHRMIHRRPFVYQEVDDEVREVAARYRIGKDRLVRFEVDEFDRNLGLVIDPEVEFSTYLGGSGDEGNTSILVEPDGHIYMTGETLSLNFPTTNGAFDRSHNGPTDSELGGDLFVLKIDPSGTKLLQSTFLGGTADELSLCHGNAIAVDGSGRIYVSGSTSSADFPVLPGAYDTSYNGGSSTGHGDAVLSVISADGARLLYSTFLGGAGVDADVCVALGAGDIPILVGETTSQTFPTTKSAFATQFAGDRDIFVAKLNPNKTGIASLEYSTLFGGEDRDGDPSFAILPDGALAIACETSSKAFPVTPGAYDLTYNGVNITEDVGLFVLDTTVAGAAALRYSTYFGGSGDEALDGRGAKIGFDRTGDLYITGETLATERSRIPFPITRNALDKSHGWTTVGEPATEHDLFLSRIRPAGRGPQDLIYSTYLGGNGEDENSSLAVTNNGYVFVWGTTDSTDYPLKDPLQKTLAGDADFSISVFHPSNALLFSTYYGGAAREKDPGGVLTRVAASGEATAGMAVRKAAATPGFYLSGESFSADYPTTAGVLGPRKSGALDVVITKFTGFDFLPLPVVTPAATTLSAASFTAPVAPASIASVFVEGASYPLTFPGPGPAPRTLGGLTVQLIDSTQTEFTSQLFFVGSNQVNLYIDDAVTAGEATVNVFEGDELVGTGTVEIRNVAPGIFFVGTSVRVAAAFSLTVNPDNSRVQVETFDTALAPREIDLGPEGAGVYLLLFGTGVRNGAGVTVTVGGESVPVLGALPHGTFIGLDQVNVGPLPRSLAGRGLVDVVITVGGVPSNAVKVRIK